MYTTPVPIKIPDQKPSNMENGRQPSTTVDPEVLQERFVQMGEQLQSFQEAVAKELVSFRDWYRQEVDRQTTPPHDLESRRERTNQTIDEMCGAYFPNLERTTKEHLKQSLIDCSSPCLAAKVTGDTLCFIGRTWKMFLGILREAVCSICAVVGTGCDILVSLFMWLKQRLVCLFGKKSKKSPVDGLVDGLVAKSYDSPMNATVIIPNSSDGPQPISDESPLGIAIARVRRVDRVDNMDCVSQDDQKDDSPLDDEIGAVPEDPLVVPENTLPAVEVVEVVDAGVVAGVVAASPSFPANDIEAMMGTLAECMERLRAARINV